MNPVLIGIAAESEGDAKLITALVDRVLIEDVAWVRETFEACRESLEDGLSPCRNFRGIAGEPYLDLHNASDRARERKLRIYGKFNDEPGADDAFMARATLFLFADEDEPPKAVIITRDVDRAPNRAKGFSQAAQSYDWNFKILVALAEPEIEAWLIAAWAPEDSSERERLKELVDELDFNPCKNPERLTSKKETDKKDAKRILKLLTKSKTDIIDRWKTTRLEQLESNGAACGLGPFIRDIRETFIAVMHAQ